MMTNDAMPMTTAQDSSSPWTNLLNQFGPGILGGAGTYLSGKQLQGYTNDAVNAAGYKPTTISGPGGGITPTRNPDGSVSYGVTGTGAPALGPLSQFAGGAAGAGSDVLSAFKNFNPQQFAQDQYTNLASLQAPTNTNQTQQMLNYEQRTGRGGLTQHGQLGDLGGLDLSQRLGDTGLRMQAEQLASQRQGQLADTASRLGGAGTTALGGVSNYNSSLMDMLRTAMTGSTGQAYAGANQGRMMYDTGTARANQTGNLFGSTLQGLADSGGGLGSSLSSIFNSLRGAFGGGGGPSGSPAFDPNNSGDMTNGMYNGGAFGGGAPYYDPSTGGYPGQADSSYGSIPQDTNGNPVWDTSMNFNAGDPSQGPMSFNSAGGEAASQSGPYQVPDSAAPGGQVDPSVSSGYASTNPFASFGTAFGDAGNASGIAAGLQRGGVSGYGSAALNANQLANRVGGYGTTNAGVGALGNALGVYNGVKAGGVSGYGGAALSANNLLNQAGSGIQSPLLGPLGNALGIYNGIKQGGIAGYGSAALNAYGLYNSPALASALSGGSGAASGAAAGAGATSGLGAAAASTGTLALALAPAIAGMRSSPVSLNSDYWNRFRTGLFNGTSGNSTYDQYTSPTYQKTAAAQDLYNMIQQQSLGQGGSMSGSWNIPSDLMQWAQQQGMLNKGYVPPSAPALTTIGGTSRGGGGRKL